MEELRHIPYKNRVSDFALTGSLVRGFLLLALSITIFTTFFSAGYYLNQHDMYLASITFTKLEPKQNSLIKNLAKSSVRQMVVPFPQEVRSDINSFDFSKRLAEKILNYPDFKKINLVSLVGFKNLSHDKFAVACKGDHDCLVSTLVQFIPGFREVQGDPLTSTKFTLEINSRDLYTSEVLLKLAVDTINDIRINRFKSVLANQQGMTEAQIENHASDTKEYVVVSSKKETLQSEMVKLDAKVINAQAKLEMTNVIVGNQTTTEPIDHVQKSKDLMTKMDSWKNDLKLLEENMTTDNDRLIVDQVRAKIKRTQLEIDDLNMINRYISNDDNSTKKTNPAIENNEKENLKAENNTNDFKKEYEDLVTESKKLENEDRELDRKLASMKPTLGYINSLKSKLTQVQKLIETIQSDLVFAQNSSRVQKVPRTSLSKIILLASSITVFFLLFGITLLYISRRKILDEEDIRRIFPQHDIIGCTPVFNISGKLSDKVNDLKGYL